MTSTPLNEEALANMARVHYETGRTDYRKWDHLYPAIQEELVDQIRPYAEAVLAVAQPVVNSVEELDALPHGTVIMATGGNWNPQHPELFLKCGYAHAPWMALDPSDRDDGEYLESSGAVLKWRCHGEARVIYRPEVSDA